MPPAPRSPATALRSRGSNDGSRADGPVELHVERHATGSVATVADLGGPADRVLVADDGTVLFTNGVDVRRGRVDADGSTPVYGLAPGPAVTLALG